MSVTASAFSRFVLVVTALLSGGAIEAVASHPAVAAATLAAIASTVSCASTGTSSCQTYTNTKSGIGVDGTSASGTGVRAASTSNYGLKSTSTTGNAIFGQVTSPSSSSSVAGVIGTSPSGYGVYGSTTQDAGYGTFGTAPLHGVVGSATSSAINAIGTSGESTAGDGVFGRSNTGIGVSAEADDDGGVALRAFATSGSGVDSTSASGTAIFGSSGSGYGADIEGGADGIVGRAPASGGYPLVLTDENSNNVFYVDGTGNVFYHGSLKTFARTKSGASVAEYSPRSSAPTVEDTGTAQLVDGSATVRLDPTFAATIDTTAPYRVFITPDGDTRGLFVASKTTQSFVVRETQGGRSTLAFDYRIIAASVGEGGKRMAVASAAAVAGPHAPIVAHRTLETPHRSWRAKK